MKFSEKKNLLMKYVDRSAIIKKLEQNVVTKEAFNMKMLSVILLGLALLLIVGIIAFAYYRLTIRFVSIFNKKSRKDYNKKKKCVFITAAIILTVLTVNLFGATGIVLLHFIVFAGFMEIVNKIIKFLFFDKNLRVWEIINKSLIIPAICTAVVVIYGYFNIHNIVRTEYTIYTNEVYEECKIVLITDIHYGTVINEEELDEVIARINEENADLVILGGDMVDESTAKEDIIKLYDKLGSIKNELGIYHVEGNHDRQKYLGNPTLSNEEYEAYKENSTIKFIEDDVVQINNDILLVGRLDVSNKDRAGIDELLYRADEDKYIIVADHQPVEYELSKEAGANLVLSGHTHAGQIFPVGYLTTLVGNAEQNYGLMQDEHFVGIVSSGLVGWGFPIRTSGHCEYVVINVKPGK